MDFRGFWLAFIVSLCYTLFLYENKQERSGLFRVSGALLPGRPVLPGLLLLDPGRQADNHENPRIRCIAQDYGTF